MVQLKQFGRYEIIRKLGRSMTDVYLALDPAENRRVILKLIELARDGFTQTVIEAEQRGAQIQKQLHEADPRILEIYEFGEQNGCFFVAMEYFQGKNIHEILQLERRLEPRRAARYAIEVLSQLDRLHAFVSDVDGRRRAVVHGDIKPSNIQIGDGGQVRLLDFGIAKAITYTHNLTHHNLGSPTYCSPERLANAQVDPHSDLWAVGVSLYEMLSGAPPYQAQTTRKLDALIQSRRPPRALPPDCPSSLRAIVFKALAADISRRYPSAMEFESDVRAFIEDRPTQAANEKLPSWEANDTVRKSAAESDRLRSAIFKRASAGLASVRETFSNLSEKIAARRPAFPGSDFSSVLWALGAGMLFGLFVVMPASYYFSFRGESRRLRESAGYTRGAATEMEADWNLYQKLERENRFLGSLSPAAGLTQPLRFRLATAAGDVIERYRNSSEPSPSSVDWAKARAALLHAAQLDPGDPDTRGKLALCDGYLNLIRDQALPNAARSEASFHSAAADLPRSPDPHLALARVYTYAYRNPGKALAELTEAERLGYRLGPREFEEEADGYLYRAQSELGEARRAVSGAQNDAARIQEARWLRLAAADFNRSRNLYEPIAGFSNVSADLEQLDRDSGVADQMRAALSAPVQTAKKRRTVKPKPKRSPPRRHQYISSAIWR